MYRVFDLCIDSEWPLAGLTAGEAGPADWTVRRARTAIQAAGFRQFHTWRGPDGQEIMAGACRDGRYLLEFFGLAKFLIDFTGRSIAAQPEADCPATTLTHLLLDQVLPRAVCHSGKVVLHASAVVLPDGRAVAFAGPTGRGKSTLASAFQQRGHRVLTDDCLSLELQGGVLHAIPAYPSLRLWPDVIEHLYGSDALERSGFAEMAHYTDKKQIPVDAGGPPGGATWPQLAALFLLSEPAPPPVSAAVDISRAGGRATLLALVEASFALDVVDPHAVCRGFEAVGRVAHAVDAFQLAYLRDFNTLSHVVDTIENFAPSCAP